MLRVLLGIEAPGPGVRGSKGLFERSYDMYGDYRFAFGALWDTERL